MHMKNTLYIVSAGVLVGLFMFAGVVAIAEANTTPAVGTYVSGTFEEDVTWQKSASPYILSGDLFLNGPHTLTIEPGVRVELAPERSNMPTAIYINDGKLNIRGTSEEHVDIGGIDKIHLSNAAADVSFADMTTSGPGLILYWSHATVSTSTFSRSTGTGMYVLSSSVDIRDSQFTQNDFSGIAIVADTSSRPGSSVTIHGSVIADNGRYSISNKGMLAVQAEDNWWGTESGPVSSDGSSLTGKVSYDPWLTEPPAFYDVPPQCCSSVLFIPGLQASRLYRPESGLSGMTGDNRLWEPNRNDDVRKLFLNPDGSSIDGSIYAGDPIGNAYGAVGVYGSFMGLLDSLAEQGTIGEWKSFSYDWRKPITEVVAGRTQRATTTESLLETLEGMAVRSKTGKVTLVAHSNGGLVTKYLIKTLADQGRDHLVDSVISVAVPYLGTPQSILALLEGDKQSIGAGLFLKKSVAKELGRNMPSSYPLLPSAEYFSRMIGPTIAYASTTSAPLVSASAQNSFISSRANAVLIKAAEVLHGVLDPFVWPATIARWAIVGWGNRTAKGIVYSDASATKYEATMTSLGDGTVVAPSAAYESGITAAIDLQSVSTSEGRTIAHSNILESEATQQVIEKILTDNSADASTKAELIGDKIARIPQVTIGEPDYGEEATFLVLSTHSPVDLHVYDSDGNHTGRIQIPSEYGIEDDVFSMFETNIPGSSFDMYGDDEQPETYISVPDEDNGTYAVAIQGTGVGEFTYRVERVQGGNVLSSVDYSGLPVTPLMTATSTVTAGTSSTTPLNIDVDGDGSTDIVARPGMALDPVVFFESLKKTVLRLLGPGKRTDVVIKRIQKIEDAFKKNKVKKIDKVVRNLHKKFASKKFSQMSESAKNEIMTALEQFIAQFE